MKNFIKIYIIILFLASPEIYANKFNIKDFKPDSYSQILNKHKGTKLTLIFWSINCPPCIKELKIISKEKLYLKNKYIFISTDPEEAIKDIHILLNRLGLHQHEHWGFYGEQTEELINSVDKSWYGEVPRNYYFNRKHQRKLIKIFKE